MNSASDLITIGQLGGAFGVHGEVRLKSFCADPASLVEYGPYVTDRGMEIGQIILRGQTKGSFVARVDGILTKEQADQMRGANLMVPRDRLPSLPDDEFYHADLIGLEVIDTGGDRIGTVKAVQNYGAGDLLEVIVPGASASVLLPFTREAVPTVDLGANRLIANPPEGALPGGKK